MKFSLFRKISYLGYEKEALFEIPEVENHYSFIDFVCLFVLNEGHCK